MSAATIPPATDADPGHYPQPGGGSGVTRLSRRLIVALFGAALIAVIAAVSFYLFTQKTVLLALDGSPQTIETRAGTVGELLAEQQVATSPDDVVQPSVESELGEGTKVQVLFARQLITVVDGAEVAHTVTERVLSEALAAVGAPVEGAAISEALEAAVPQSGMTVEIVTPKTVTLADGGRTRSAVSTAKTVEGLLADEGVSLGEDDRLTPLASTAVTEGLTVEVTRIRVEDDVRTEPIAHDTTEKNDDSLLVGTRDVTTEGRDGEREVTFAVTYTNGEATSEEQINVTVTREPVTEVVNVGTKPAPVVAAAQANGGAVGGEAAGLNWAALAECESSGNPKAVNPAGYYGLYQFSPRTWASVGGAGNPADATPAEQLKRAQILYNKAGVGQWPHCGPNLYK